MAKVLTIGPYEIEVPEAFNVVVTEDSLNVDLNDGRTVSVPLPWFPRLYHASSTERDNWRFIDEDISVEGLLVGVPSGESQSSFKKWLEARQGGYA